LLQIDAIRMVQQVDFRFVAYWKKHVCCECPETP